MKFSAKMPDFELKSYFLGFGSFNGLKSNYWLEKELPKGFLLLYLSPLISPA
jgi:hypothetical protein